ncbi:MAG: hypothetical protein HYR73_06325 [Candidatus Eisenbacteria bacterium]|nr:hypothetical protein [Candidatus Eisenbacteria bacterium]
MSDISREERVSRALCAVRAEIDDRALRRALDRLGERERVQGWLAWTLRPAALATAAALLVVSAGTTLWWVGADSERSSLTDQVLDAAGWVGVADLEAGVTQDAASDSGAIR